ncbi:MAG: hypothetical protein V4726_01010 [Verrucomicrobiota bacterium]
MSAPARIPRATACSVHVLTPSGGDRRVTTYRSARAITAAARRARALRREGFAAWIVPHVPHAPGN